MMALGLVRAAVEAGLSVPRDLSVVGFDDIQLAAHVNPPLTTVRQDKAGLGAAAAEALLREIDGADAPAPVTLPVQLLVRGSTGPPAAARVA
jgi:LacI family transcriptional regulator